MDRTEPTQRATRTIVTLREPQMRRLDQQAKRAGRSRSALIREAIDKYLGPEDVLSLEQVFGLWGDHKIDGLEYQRAIRAEWDRDWDPD